MTYDILATGSSGNCTIIEDCIAVDMGISFKKLSPYYRQLKLVLLSHIHGDHFNKRTISRLAKERPLLRFGCCEWLVAPLVECGVEKKNIDVYDFERVYGYATGAYGVIPGFSIQPFPLFHDVENAGFKVWIHSGTKLEKLLYATDTNKILTEAKDYDLYLIEANYDDEEVQERIDRQIIEGKEFIHEYKAMENHLSRQAAYDFVCANMGANSRYVLMHEHKEKGDSNHGSDT
jgi:phosphoribosyl 1,2-cyclic phosphodiesterase